MQKEGAKRRKVEKEEEGRKRKSEAKISFLRKFFPEVNSSQGGSNKLLMRQDLTHIRRDGTSDRNYEHDGRAPRNNFSTINEFIIFKTKN